MKKILSVLTAAVLLFSLFTPFCFAVAGGGVSIGSASANPGQSFSLDVTLSGNPGIIALRLFITYDRTKLRLDSVEDKGILGTGTALFGNDYSASPFVLMWDDSLSTVNYTANGVAAKLHFTVLPGASAGYTDVSLSVDAGSTFNASLQNVTFLPSGGRVKINSTAPLTITSRNVSAASGETFTVPLIVTSNPGIVGLRLSIKYDTEVLTLLNVEDCGLLGSTTALFGNDFSASPYSVLWEDGLAAADRTAAGELCILHFSVNPSAPTCTTEITVSCANGDAYNHSLNRVNTQIYSPSVSVTGKTGSVHRYYGIMRILDWIFTKIFNNTLGKIFGVEFPSKFGYK